MKRYDVVLRGAYGTGNFGDDALLYSLLLFLSSRGNRTFAIVSKKGAYLTRFFPDLDITLVHPSENNQLSTRYFIWGGGTQFFSFPGSLFLRKKLLDVARHPFRFVAARLPGKAIKLQVEADIRLMIGIGFGPFRNERSEAKAMKLAASCNYVFVRDEQSYKIASKRLSPEKLGQYVDICYLTQAYLSAVGLKSSSEKSGTARRVAFIVRDWAYTSEGRAHVERTLDLARQIGMDKELEIDFVFFATDAKSKALVESNGFNCISWNPDTSKIIEFIDIINSYDYIVTSRFHGMIFAVLLQKPCMIIAIEEKLDIAYLENSLGCTYWPRPFEIPDGLTAFRNMLQIAPEAIALNRQEKLRIAQQMELRLNEYI